MVPIDPAPRKKRWPVGRALACTIAAVVLVTHAYQAWQRFWPGQADPQLPFTTTDHPLQYYYGQLTRQFFHSRFAFWGYDPTFMAGYGKSIVFPTSSTAPDLVALVSGRHAAWTYNLISTLSAFLTPIVLACAAIALARSQLAGLIALLLSVQWTWCSWPNAYIEWGMGPFVFTSAMSVLSASLLTRWFDGSSTPLWYLGTFVGTIAVILHPLSLLTIGLALTPSYVIRARRLHWHAHVASWCTPLVIALCWSPWWLPAIVLRDTYGTSAIGFVNENVRGRMDELLQGRFPEETALLICALLACPVLVRFEVRRGVSLLALGAILLLVVVGSRWMHWQVSIETSWHMISLIAAVLAIDFGMGIIWHGEARGGGLFGGALLLFALAYFGGAAEWLWRLQPGRFTQPLYALLIVLVAVSIPELVAKLREWRWRNLSHYQALTSLVLLGLVGGAVAPRGAAFLFQPHVQPLRCDLPEPVHELARAIRDQNTESGRILFEDRGRLSLGLADPFDGTNPSALMPLLAPGQYIGGPYLYTNLQSNFTQFGDGKLFERPVTSLKFSTFDRYATLYNVRWMVCWSQPMVRLAELHPDYFHEQGRFGFMRLYSLTRDSNWAVAGRADVHASPDRLEVSNAQPDADGRIILSYHWIATLRSPAAIRPILLEDDPVPFIAVDDAPSDFVIENRLW